MKPDQDFATRLTSVGDGSAKAPSAELDALLTLITREELRLRRYPRWCLAGWLGTILIPSLGAYFSFKRGGSPVGNAFDSTAFENACQMAGVCVMASFWLVLALGIGYAVMKHFLNQHKIQAAMLRVEAQLIKGRSERPEDA